MTFSGYKDFNFSLKNKKESRIVLNISKKIIIFQKNG